MTNDLPGNDNYFRALVSNAKSLDYSPSNDKFYMWNGTSVGHLASVISYLTDYEPQCPELPAMKECGRRFLKWYNGCWLLQAKPQYWDRTAVDHLAEVVDG